MSNALRGLLLCCLAAFVACAGASDQGEIKTTFNSYWAAIAKGDFKAAAVFVHPDDLAQLRREVLPVLLDASKSDDPQVRPMVGAFFGTVPAEERGKVSGPELYRLCISFVNSYNRQTMEALEKAERTIIEVQLANPTKAVVRYTLNISGKSSEAKDTLGKVDGAWYMNMRQSPKQLADLFRQAFNQA